LRLSGKARGGKAQGGKGYGAGNAGGNAYGAVSAYGAGNTYGAGNAYGGSQQSSYGSDSPTYSKPTYSKPTYTSYGTPYKSYKNKPQQILTIAPRRFIPIPFAVPTPVATPVVAPVAHQQVIPQSRSTTVLTIQPTYQETPTYQEQPTYQPQQTSYGGY
jgi:hypothetical protein